MAGHGGGGGGRTCFAELREAGVGRVGGLEVGEVLFFP